ncbi:MAG: hypothetical protein HOY79_34040 [Streptomyces sp.]|nr:hypothetical protein [Streptomyces sp.]NUS11421.1 hypothetical protein [Streptomyces sp.]NUS23438.1 hypothetical protein [Streptomyces sp.]
MPSAKPPRGTEPTPQPTEAAEPVTEEPAAPPAEEPAPAAPSGPPPGVYEYTHYTDCVYPHVPLSARAACPAIDGPHGQPATAATVFDWPFGAPDDGRWTPTKKKPNQAADNMPPLSSEE